MDKTENILREIGDSLKNKAKRLANPNETEKRNPQSAGLVADMAMAFEIPEKTKSGCSITLKGRTIFGMKELANIGSTKGAESKPPETKNGF